MISDSRCGATHARDIPEMGRVEASRKFNDEGERERESPRAIDPLPRVSDCCARRNTDKSLSLLFLLAEKKNHLYDDFARSVCVLAPINDDDASCTSRGGTLQYSDCLSLILPRTCIVDHKSLCVASANIV